MLFSLAGVPEGDSRPSVFCCVGPPVSVPAGAAHREGLRAGTAHSRQGRAVLGAAERTLDGEHRSGIAQKADGRRSGITFLLVGLEPDSDWDSSADGSGSLTRRLITLIFAGRNRMDMIRRELPLTKRAGSIRKPFRIERNEDSPFRWSSSVIGAAVLACMCLYCSLGCWSTRLSGSSAASRSRSQLPR